MIENELQREYFNKVVCSPSGNYYVIMNFLHLFLMIISVAYPLLTNKNKYDFIYLIFLYIVIIHWIYLKNECLVNYLEKIKIDPEYKLGTNILSPGINYILSNFNISIYNQTENNFYKEESHNLVVPTLTLILFSYVAIRYLKKTTTKFIYIFIYALLVYVLVFKVSRI
jgi:hypothetical protein